MEKIQMVDVRSQYLKIKEEVDSQIKDVIDSCAFINGPKVKEFQAQLEEYLGVNHVIPVANGTDALQIALMALDLKHGDEIIVPAHTYVATAEVIALLGLKPIMVDVDPDTFNLTSEIVKKSITDKTKAIVPVHLYGQCAEMEEIISLGKQNNIAVIEDAAQAIGCDYTFSNGKKAKAGTIGDIGCTSFYPSKNLGAYGDGGAIFCNDDALAKKIRMIANHGQSKRYYHDVVGCNSRLDSIQAAILNVKLKHLDDYNDSRVKVANSYDDAFKNIDGITIPKRASFSSHVFHQYTLRIGDGKRDGFKDYLDSKNVPNMIYYPVPLYKQKAFGNSIPKDFNLRVTALLSDEVISLPIHSEMQQDQLEYIINTVKDYFKS